MGLPRSTYYDAPAMKADDREIVAGWTVEGRRRVTLPRPAERIVSLTGQEIPPDGSKDGIELTPSVRYIYLIRS